MKIVQQHKTSICGTASIKLQHLRQQPNLEGGVNKEISTTLVTVEKRKGE